ncbi:MAG: putative sensor protein, partial [Candidatus Saccharibacteria bacterium]|nr:putative sensor protein [Candidatus Saccharibacteria bacterium]
MRGIGQPGGVFNVSILTVSLAVVSLAIAITSYFWASERYYTTSALAAYIIMLASVSVLISETGGGSSPFLALWMIASVFSGVFGMALLGLLGAGIIAIFGYLLFSKQLDAYIIFTLSLGGLLPLLMSFVLWHGKSSTEKTKERAYYDLANELNQVANKSEVVINAISDGVIAIGNTGQIELINPAAERLVGWAHQDAMGLDYKSVMQLLGKNDHELEKSTDPVFEVLTTNQPKRSNDLQLQTSSGKKVQIELVVSPIGRLGAGAIMVFRDITKEQAEERAQAEFISTASHEMRTPVASIEGYLGLALNPATATIDAKAHEYITKAHESAEHLGRLFQDLLDVTKADDGRMQNNPKVLDVVSFTADVVEGLKPKADEKQLRLFFKAAKDARPKERNVEPIFYVDLDKDHLREVVANLVE